MAIITKAEKIKQYEDQLPSWLAAVDSLIRESDGVGLTIAFEKLKVPYGLHSRFIAALKEAGWDCKLESDFRNGSYWSIR